MKMIKAEGIIPVFPFSVTKRMRDRPDLCDECKGFKNPYPSGWRLSQKRLEEEYQKGNIVITRGVKLERRKYLKDYQGEPLDNNWVDHTDQQKERNARAILPKNHLALLERIIKASSQRRRC